MAGKTRRYLSSFTFRRRKEQTYSFLSLPAFFIVTVAVVVVSLVRLVPDACRIQQTHTLCVCPCQHRCTQHLWPSFS